MSEPDSPRWLEELGPELRREVPVRDEWRARLLAGIARAPRPSATDPLEDDREWGGPVLERPGRRDRRITLRPLTALAAAAVFAAVGAAGALAGLPGGARGTVYREPLCRSAPPGPADARGGHDARDREIVRFELSAPTASHVTLVGSFNGWNPEATPLVRDSITGTWRVALRLPPGRHVYTFVVDGDVTADPAAPRAADDDFGSENSVLLVAGPAS
jgi:hypothetical protein